MTAAITSGWAWPRISGPHEQTQSMYSLPSTSVTVEPLPDAMKIGSRPIERIARTGELTPPGMSSSARCVELVERAVFIVAAVSAPVTRPACSRSQAR